MLTFTGLSYYSRLRHEMRVAFWWKLNWAWFCIIQRSYDDAIKPVTPDEVEPFPDAVALTDTKPDSTPKEIEVKNEDRERADSTQQSSDQDTISEPMEDVVPTQSTGPDIPEELREYWDMAKRLNRKRGLPKYLGEDEWIAIGDVLVELGNELSKYGLLDMDLGLWENEIMHRTNCERVS
jgi:hypothetical protein